VTAVLVPTASFSAITGKAAPVEYEALETRVVDRLSALLGRDLSAEFDADTVPTTLAHAVAFGVETVAAPKAPQLPAGYQSMSVAGEYSVAVMSGMVQTSDGVPLPAHLSHVADLGGRCVSFALKHRRVAL
jgi:hypothetical protein